MRSRSVSPYEDLNTATMDEATAPFLDSTEPRTILSIENIDGIYSLDEYHTSSEEAKLPTVATSPPVVLPAPVSPAIQFPTTFERTTSTAGQMSPSPSEPVKPSQQTYSTSGTSVQLSPMDTSPPVAAPAPKRSVIQSTTASGPTNKHGTPLSSEPPFKRIRAGDYPISTQNQLRLEQDDTTRLLAQALPNFGRIVKAAEELTADLNRKLELEAILHSDEASLAKVQINVARRREKLNTLMRANTDPEIRHFADNLVGPILGHLTRPQDESTKTSSGVPGPRAEAMQRLNSNSDKGNSEQQK
ncbi:hypothetical protein N7456_011095 [Penicillium angulare]|uniref:Uncharacterized protein n=1 Tax=Penicillium angulare TaxID=116970 RepID=A0A9W9JZD4_9EURO|nr:hypothetical protein N7456_011095 [Penicillium angulare]